MVNITTHTEAAAVGQKICHLTQPPHQGRCCGSQCMAWQWAGCAELKHKCYLSVGYNVPEELSEKPSDAEIQKHYPKSGDGWQLAADDSVYFYNGTDDMEESCWVVNWERDADPEREGYCAALNHPMAVLVKLDEISAAIYERGGV